MSPLILFRTGFFGAPPRLDGLSEKEQACFTSDQRRLREADAVVFHIPDFRPRQMNDTPKYPGQRWVAWSMESCENYPRLKDPSFMRAFDIKMTYERSSQIWTPYLPTLPEWQAACEQELAAKRDDAQVAMFQSAPINRSGRHAFAQSFMRAMPVHSYGRHLRTVELDEPDLGRPTKLKVIRRYRFCLALENSIAPDYVTEKIFDPLLCGTIPIYLGAPNVDDFVPPGSIIKAHDFKSVDDLSAYVRFVAATPSEYERFFAWRSLGADAVPVQARWTGGERPFAQLLEHVAMSKAAEPIRRGALPAYPFGAVPAIRARLSRFLRS